MDISGFMRISQNRRLIFPEIDWNKQFGMHVYGSSQVINFIHVASGCSIRSRCFFLSLMMEQARLPELNITVLGIFDRTRSVL